MSNTKTHPTIQTLYPDLSPQQQEEAAYWLRRYIAVIWRIYARKHGIDASDLTR